MSQPMPALAPAYPATPAVARINASPLLDGWSSLSPVALPVLAPSPASPRGSARVSLVEALLPRHRLPARAA